MRTYRSGGGGDVTPSHSGGDFGSAGPTTEQSTARRLFSGAKFLAAPVIILLLASLLVPTLVRARRPSYELRCIAQLKQVATAINMYASDQGTYPPPHDWHNAIRTYIDDPLDPHGRVIPGSSLDPLTCPSDPTDATVSYLYLNRNVLDWSKANLAESVIPLVVDEYFHEHTTLAYYDGHAEKLEKQFWLHNRTRQWEIRRNLDDIASFSYEPVPGSVRGPQGPAPVYDRTQEYTWPKF
ncbi:MAG: hypothetical protein GX131_00425 [candidate division WS1 bacterium]|nr:hypothetical protein [candidate division WS1 bacterium]